MKPNETWNVTRHATPEHTPQFGIYRDGESTDFAIIRGPDAEATAHRIAHTANVLPELINPAQVAIDYLDLIKQNYPDLPGLIRALTHLKSAVAKATTVQVP